jgi:DNA polymerase
MRFEAVRHLSIDIETFSSVDIKKAGLYRYVQSPDFRIILFAYSFDGGLVQIADLAQGEGIPYDVIMALQDPTVVKHAYNAAFEYTCLNKYGCSPLEQWRCTQVHALYCGYPAGLEATGTAMGLPQDKRKLNTGRSLIKTFCTPCTPTAKNGNRTRTMPHHEPEKWGLFKTYCKQDVVTEMEIESRLSAFPLPEDEQRLWELDQRINAFGVMVDLGLIDGALHCSETVTDELTKEAMTLSGLQNPKSVKQLTEWLNEEADEEIENLQKDTVKGLIEKLDDGKVKRMLEIRQELAKTSVKKYTAMRAAVCEDGRICGLLQFYGANRTGRWAGRLVQVHNLPKNHLEALGHARNCVIGKKVDAIKLIFGSIPDLLSQLIRTAFIPSPEHQFLVADFSAIEARIIAWLAGEQWRLDVFATHGKIYEASASQMFGVPIEDIKKGDPLRQKGKVAELALGYQGAAGALTKMDTDKKIDPEEYPEIVKRWRAANKRIVDLWYTIENAAVEVMRTGQAVGVKGIIFAREIDYKNDQDFLTIRLPSGRKLYYVKPFLAAGEFGKESLYYHGLIQDSKQWGKIPTYGGKLTENIVQAIARDCLAESLKRLEGIGYPIAFHVHDEVIIDIAGDENALEHICNMMSQPISWAPGLLLKAEGFMTPFYKKE